MLEGFYILYKVLSYYLYLDCVKLEIYVVIWRAHSKNYYKEEYLKSQYVFFPSIYLFI